MRSITLAIGCVAASAIIAIVCHPRVFFGTGTSASIVSLDGLFFAGQWIALALAAFALMLSAMAMSNGAGAKGASVAPATVMGVAALIVVWLLATGVPHPANRSEWRNRELGARAFLRGMSRQRTANAPPPALSAAAFAGAWRSDDGTTFTFAGDRVAWAGTQGSGEYSAPACGGTFRLTFTGRPRDVLQDLGLTWSAHAGERYDATPPDAQVPVAQVECAGSEPVTFIKAGDDEVWLWTSSLDLDAIKRGAFVLRRVSRP